MSKYRLYLYDLGYELKLRAIEARRERDSTLPGSSERTYYSGRVIAFNEVISIIQQQAEGFEIPLTELRLDDIVPDRDLT